MKLWSRQKTADGAQSPKTESISRRARLPTSPRRLAAFFAIFLLAGLGFLAFFVGPVLGVMAAWSWTAVDCEIVSSEVASHAGSDGFTYSIEVVYRYKVDGVEYTGDRYDFLGGSSSGYESKQRRVAALAAGSVTTCFVDPKDASEVVLERGFSWPYLFVLLPLVFVAVGGVGMWWALTGGGTS